MTSTYEISTDITEIKGKKNLLKIENLNQINVSVCKNLTFDEQIKIYGGSITGTGSRIRYYYR